MKLEFKNVILATDC